MSVNLAFWKKKKDIEEIGPPDDDSMLEVPSPLPTPESFSINKYSEPSAPPSLVQDQNARYATPDKALDKDFQLLNAKLDGIKATLDSISQRLENLERRAPRY